MRHGKHHIVSVRNPDGSITLRMNGAVILTFSDADTFITFATACLDQARHHRENEEKKR